MDNRNIVSVTNDPRLDTAIEGAKPVWLPILRESYRIPEVVGEETAIAAILKDVEAYLTPSEIDPDNQPVAAPADIGGHPRATHLARTRRLLSSLRSQRFDRDQPRRPRRVPGRRNGEG